MRVGQIGSGLSSEDNGDDIYISGEYLRARYNAVAREQGIFLPLQDDEQDGK